MRPPAHLRYLPPRGDESPCIKRMWAGKVGGMLVEALAYRGRASVLISPAPARGTGLPRSSAPACRLA